MSLAWKACGEPSPSRPPARPFPDTHPLSFRPSVLQREMQSSEASAAPEPEAAMMTLWL